MEEGLSSGTDKAIRRRVKICESKQWYECQLRPGGLGQQAIYFHRVITTQIHHIFWAPPSLLSLRFSGFMASGLGLGSSPIGHVHALCSFLPSFASFQNDFSCIWLIFSLFPLIDINPSSNISRAIATTIGRITGRRIHTDIPNRNNIRPTPHSPRLISKIRLTPPRSECESQRDEIELKDGPTRKLLFYFLFPPVTAEPLKYHPCTTPYQHRALQIECPALLTG
jgi:hypothetical protein